MEINSVRGVSISYWRSAVLALVLPWPASLRSMTSTFMPAAESVSAISAPVMPAPTITTSQRTLFLNGGQARSNPLLTGQNGWDDFRSTKSETGPQCGGNTGSRSGSGGRGPAEMDAAFPNRWFVCLKCGTAFQAGAALTGPRTCVRLPDAICPTFSGAVRTAPPPCLPRKANRRP